VPVLLFEHNDWIGNGGVYAETAIPDLPGVEPNLPRFALFSLAAAQYVAEHADEDSIFHCHDWHLAAAIPFLKNHFGAPNIKTLFTIHNLAYQGGYGFEQVKQVLGDELIRALPKESLLMGNSAWYNLMLSAILTSDWVSTVSQTYRNEILTPEYGADLETFLQAREDRLVGIVNGIDTERWDPETDPSLEKTYGPDSLEVKAESKKLLQKELGLPVNENAFMVGMVSRIAEQKGYDILDPALPVLLEDLPDMQFVMLGTGDPQATEDLKAAESRFPTAMVFVNKFDEDLAHRIYAASDTFYMPSRYEPCGLGQLFAMRYGTLPIARATGGLKDTVIAGKTGFVFDAYTPEGVIEATKEAAKVFAEDKGKWSEMIGYAIERDSSWDASAALYLDLYRRMHAA
jgi:starch synthase